MPFTTPENGEQLISFMHARWNSGAKVDAREIVKLMGGHKLYYAPTHRGRYSYWLLPTGERVVIRNDGLAIREIRGQNSHSNKGPHRTNLRESLTYLIAALDADIPMTEIFRSCISVQKAISTYKQIATAKEARARGIETPKLKRHRQKVLENAYRYAADENTPHEFKYLRECKRLGVEP